MTTAFTQKIEQSLANQNLQAALDANTERRKKARQAVIATLPDFAERRLHAHAVKADVIAHLEEYLARFISNVEKSGIHVHRAKDSAEAVRVILEIIERSQPVGIPGVAQKGPISPHLIAKSKSMVSEEINLNHALEAAGQRVVETDLGEYIVQLRGERPSHIITPAVHLRRSDVGALFAEKLGIPYTEDIPTLTNTARRVLREVFLTADVGFSGVNLGVVESGTLCLVTNEGNGRMVTTLPPVHIALMGMERLVPTLDDLALCLSILPRSATGQKLSVYTSLIHAPLPGQTRHLVILDNGRTALRNSPLAESLYCLRCGACLNACPVFRELGGHAYGSIYPGPIGSVISSALVDPAYAYLSQASSLCGACREVCPVDIDLPGLLLRVRAGQYPAAAPKGEGVGIPGPIRLGLKAFRAIAQSPRLFAISQRLAGLAARIVSPRTAWLRLPAFTGWGYSKDFPSPAARPFRTRWQGLKQAGVSQAELEIKPRTVQESVQPEPCAPQADKIEQFTRELTVLGGHVARCRAGELPEKIIAFLQERGFEQVLVDDLAASLLPENAGIRLVKEPDAGLRCGVTGALAGIADTGSLLIGASQGQALKASLLPEVHLAILPLSRLAASLPEVLASPEFRDQTAAVILTGPSRTADIEMTLTIGVHGPGELRVFLVDD